MLTQAIWTTHGELTRGIAGIGTPDLAAVTLANDAAFARWSSDVRSRLYMFELLSELHFEAGDANAGELFRLKKAPAMAAGVLTGTYESIAKLVRPKYDSTQAGAPGGDLKTELGLVFEMATLRADRLAEILTQVVVPYSFFASLLNLQPGRHRRTFEIMSVAATFASAIGQRFKHHFRVIRPADRSTLVQPLLQTPAHSAYPAGHATQSHLISDVLTALVGAAAASESAKQLERLADRIGENRVVAGVHYPVDIVEGRRLGKALAVHLLERAKVAQAAQPPMHALAWLWREARKEWS